MEDCRSGGFTNLWLSSIPCDGLASLALATGKFAWGAFGRLKSVGLSGQDSNITDRCHVARVLMSGAIYTNKLTTNSKLHYFSYWTMTMNRYTIALLSQRFCKFLPSNFINSSSVELQRTNAFKKCPLCDGHAEHASPFQNSFVSAGTNGGQN